jgi:hypothetical protein
MKGLESLTLGGRRITDQGLTQLRNLHDLKQLIVNQTSVTTAGTTELKKALPQVKIIK